jgi:hypothetical protein
MHLGIVKVNRSYTPHVRDHLSSKSKIYTGIKSHITHSRNSKLDTGYGTFMVMITDNYIKSVITIHQNEPCPQFFKIVFDG